MKDEVDPRMIRVYWHRVMPNARDKMCASQAVRARSSFWLRARVLSLAAYECLESAGDTRRLLCTFTLIYLHQRFHGSGMSCVYVGLSVRVRVSTYARSQRLQVVCSTNLSQMCNKLHHSFQLEYKFPKRIT